MHALCTPYQHALHHIPAALHHFQAEPGCTSVKFSTHGISYSKVCGRVRGYQVGDPNAFGPYVNDPSNLDLVMDGVMISHGSSQSHIKLMQLVMKEYHQDPQKIFCLCTDYRFNGVVPQNIGNDYYCDSGVDSNPQEGVFYTTPL